MLRVLRDRSQAGRLGLDGDPVYGQRPVRGAARAEQGVGGCRVVAGFGFPAAEEPDRVIAVAGPAGPARYFPAGSPRPGRTRPGTGLPVPRCPMCPQRPRRRSATRRPRPAVGAHLRSPSRRRTPMHAPMLCLPGQTGLPVPGALHDALLLGSGEPSTGPAPRLGVTNADLALAERDPHAPDVVAAAFCLEQLRAKRSHGPRPPASSGCLL